MASRTRLYRSAVGWGCLAVLLSLLSYSSLGTSPQRKHHRHRTHSGRQAGNKGLEQIQHIVFIVKENRTFDNYFGTFPGVDGATSGTISTGDVIPLGQAPERVQPDINHSFQSAVIAIDGGAMDQFDLISGGDGSPPEIKSN